jgi:ankyrin repeat protein
VGFGDSAVIQALLQGGANVHEKESDGTTALRWAVVANHPQELKALVGAGAEVNAVDPFGYTPILYAATIDFGDFETAMTLLTTGTGPNIKDKKGKTALAHA